MMLVGTGGIRCVDAGRGVRAKTGPRGKEKEKERGWERRGRGPGSEQVQWNVESFEWPASARGWLAGWFTVGLDPSLKRLSRDGSGRGRWTAGWQRVRFLAGLVGREALPARVGAGHDPTSAECRRVGRKRDQDGGCFVLATKSR